MIVKCSSFAKCTCVWEKLCSMKNTAVHFEIQKNTAVHFIDCGFFSVLSHKM